MPLCYEDETSFLIQRGLNRMPAKLERMANRMRQESEGARLARQFFAMMRFASRAALVRSGFAKLRRSSQGGETFIPLDDEFRDPRGKRPYIPGKTVTYGPAETLSRHKLSVRNLMAELPQQWVEVFQQRVRVHAFQVVVCTTNTTDRKGDASEQAMVRPVMKFEILADGKPEGGCYYKTDNQGQFIVMDVVFQAQPPSPGSMDERAEVRCEFVDSYR